MSGEWNTRQVVAFFVSFSLHLTVATSVMRQSGQEALGQPEPPRVTKAVELLNRSQPLARSSDSTDPLLAALVPPRDDHSRTPSRSGWLLGHLWQSTIFTLAVGLLMLGLRRNGADVRYRLWFAASLKFLVPLSFVFPLGATPWSPPVSGSTIFGLWACGFAVMAVIRMRMWRRARAVVCASTRLELPGIGIPPNVELRAAPGLLEPGVVGWRRPILLLPADIQTHLTRPQLLTVVAHELCHVRRHDNLTAAIHMIVEAIFWFHPVVWWISARLVLERERACDELVQRTLDEPHVYAQAILNVCKRYIEPPLACASGIGGTSLGKRVDAILRNEVGEALGPLKKAVVSTAMMAALVMPIAFGPVNGARLNAQSPSEPADITLDAAARNDVIEGTLRALNESYVFPELAKKMEEAVRARQQRKEYDTITSGRQFAEVLTAHLREISRDLHLKVDLARQGPPLPPPPVASGRVQPIAERQRMIAGRRNFGFVRVERLAGNIGYVDVHGFMSPAIAGDTATAAMAFLSNTDAVIFDMRQNRGGDPNMVAFLTSYLFGPQPVHLNDFYSRPTSERRQSWTSPFVPGTRLANADVYILTSSHTFSGAEEFTYNLKHLKRATIVGETTGGAAHTVAGQRINDQFVVVVPTGRPINAVTKSNWEGVGIEPDVKVPAQHALNAAHLMALEQQQRRLTSDSPGLLDEVRTMLPVLRKELGAVAESIPAFDGVKPMLASRASDDFESGTLDYWRVDQQGSGGWFVYSNGRTSPAPARTDPAFRFDVPDPPQGGFAAVSEQNGPGRFILYRDVTLDGRYRLHLTVFCVNLGTFSSSTISDRNTINDEQQYRIDIVAPSAPVDSLAREHLLATVFEAKPGDAARLLPTEVIFDLSPYEGQTVRLRFAVGENQAPLRAGVDDVRFERITQ